MRPAAALLVFACACESPVVDRLVRFDSGVDAGDAFVPDAPDGATDPDLGGPCVDDGQCDDQIACTFDQCDLSLHRCRNTPDDSQCDDGVYCDGKERCVRHVGCGPGGVVSCDDNTACTIDRCVEATKSCDSSTLRDVDQDTDPDDHCVKNRDCDDLDPTVSSLRSEVCSNGKDDDCDGQIDEAQCTTPLYTSCQSALKVSAPGTWVLSSAGAPKTFAASCSVPSPNGAHDLVALVTVPGGDDLDVWVTAADKNPVAVAIFGACGQTQTELACGSGDAAWMTRARARSLAAGTYAVVVTAQTETNVELKVDFPSGSTKATNEDCSSAAPLTVGQSTKVELVDPSKDLASACASFTGELTYSFTLTQPQDVRVFSQTLVGSGDVVASLRSPACSGQGDELRCRVGSKLPLLARSQPAGTYVLAVAATAPLDASVLVQLSAPTTPPPGQDCSTSPAALVNGTLAFDLSSYEDAIKDGCLAGGPTASWKIDLAQASDVMLVARYPLTEIGAVSLDTAACTKGGQLACWASSTPVRVDKRNVAAGSWRAVVADSYGQMGSLTTLVRPTVAPINVTTADKCSDFVDIPSAGGFLTGDTSMGPGADFDESCDAVNLPMGGAPDQIFRLVLAKTQRVVLDMDGSVFPTILSVRQGGACPGQEIMNGCNVGFSGPRSFLDVTLGAGTYWVVVDGYALQKGSWNLDARVVDP